MWQQIIKKLKDQGFSQKALAELIGSDQSTICRWANGVGPEPRFSVGLHLIRLADCPAIEQLAGVRCGELRPDVEWSVLRGPGASVQESQPLEPPHA